MASILPLRSASFRCATASVQSSVPPARPTFNFPENGLRCKIYSDVAVSSNDDGHDVVDKSTMTIGNVSVARPILELRFEGLNRDEGNKRAVPTLDRMK